MVDEISEIWRPGAVILDLYEVRDVISSGGMGLVYRVLHRGWNVELAVKVPRPGLVSTAQGLRGFEDEAATWVALGEHPHTVNCVYVRRLDGLPRVFAEWVDGGSLSEVVRYGALYADGPGEALRRILDIAIQIAWGLEHAHRHPLVHQDVKPANVLLTRDGTAKVTDFGLARARAAAGESGAVPQGAGVLATFGGLTPAYCSPEQARAAAWRPKPGRPRPPLTRATDTWSWALTVLEMFVGRPPCRRGQAGAEVFAMFLAEPGADRRVPAMPDGVAALLERCLAKNPADRPRDMGALARELADIYADVVGDPYPRPEPQVAVRLADELGNQALSMLDLGRTEDAEELWRRAAEADPHNLHAVYNRGLHLWRAGRITDAQLIGDLEGARAGVPAEYLTGLVHLERGDTASAQRVLRTIAKREPGSADISAALEQAENLPRVAAPRTLSGHTASVNAVALSTDGRTGASASSDGTIRVWDVAACREVLELKVTDAEYGALFLAMDAVGRRAVLGDFEGPAQVWDLRRGRLRHVLSRGTDHDLDRAWGVAMSADGRLVLTAHETGIVRVWDAKTGRYLPALDDGPRDTGIRKTALSADGRLAFSLDRRPGHPSLIWEPRTGRLLGTLQGNLSNAVLSADGRTAAITEIWAGQPEGTVHFLDLSTGRSRTITRPGKPADIAAMSPDGRHALFAQFHTVELWETAGRCLQTWENQGEPVSVVLGANTALIGDSDGTVTVREWAPAGPRARWSYPRPRAASARNRESDQVRDALDRTAELIDQGRFTAAAEEIRTARAVPGYRRHRPLLDRWHDLARIGRRTTLSGAWLRGSPPIEGHEPRVAGRDSAVLLNRSTDGDAVQVWDLFEGKRHHILKGHGAYINKIALSDDDRIAMSAGGRDGTVRVWDVQRGRCLHVLRGADHVEAIAMSADGRTGLTEDGSVIRVWDLTTGECRHKLIGHTDRVMAVMMSADARLAFSWGMERTPRIWDVRTAECLHVLSSPDWGHDDYSLSRAGNVLLSSHRDATVKVWDVQTGECRHVLPAHEFRVNAMAASADGRTGVTISATGTMRVWDLGTGQCRHTVREAVRPPVHEVAVSADARFAVTGGGDGLIRIWDLESGARLRDLAGHEGEIMRIWINGNGHLVTSHDRRGTTRVWELDWEFAFPEQPAT